MYSDNDFTQYLSNMNNMDSMYIEPVTEEEILQLVNNAKSKTSKGHGGLDMCLVKKIIPLLFGRGWVTPLVYISLNILHRMPLIVPIFKRCFGRCKQVR